MSKGSVACCARGNPLLATSAYDIGHDVGSLVAIVAFSALLIARIVRMRRSAAPPRTAATVEIWIIGVLLAGGIVSLAGRHAGTSDPWSTPEGRNMTAGFIDGCTRNSGALLDCRCLLDALRATPSYDTPEGMDALLGQVQSAGGDPNLMPPAYVAAVQSCRT